MVEGINIAHADPESIALDSRINASQNQLAGLRDDVVAPELDLHQSEVMLPPRDDNKKTLAERGEDYVKAFINNKMVSQVFPNIMNWLNIIGNVFSLSSFVFGFREGAKKFAQALGSYTTKAFLIATAVINIVERCYTKNYLSAVGYFNDILVASLVKQDDTYLARGTASGTYNMSNSLSISNDRTSFKSLGDHVIHLGQAYKKFFNNLFSKNVLLNFTKSSNAMWAIFGGIFANIGAVTWMFTGMEKLSTLVRDIAGVMMDIEQLNYGHYKAGRKNYFKSGMALALGTFSDFLSKYFPHLKEAFVPLTFILDGIGRHLLRLHQNKHENIDGSQNTRSDEPLVQMAA